MPTLRAAVILAAFLINIFATPGVEFLPDGESTIEGRTAAQYRYRVPLSASRPALLSEFDYLPSNSRQSSAPHLQFRW